MIVDSIIAEQLDLATKFEILVVIYPRRLSSGFLQFRSYLKPLECVKDNFIFCGNFECIKVLCETFGIHGVHGQPLYLAKRSS